MQKETRFNCPNVGSASTRSCEAGAGAGDDFLPALGLRYPLGSFAAPRPCSSAGFLRGAACVCRNAVLKAWRGPLGPTFKVQNRFWHMKLVLWGLHSSFVSKHLNTQNCMPGLLTILPETPGYPLSGRVWVYLFYFLMFWVSMGPLEMRLPTGWVT